MNRAVACVTYFALICLTLLVPAPAAGQEPTLVVENARVIVGDRTVLERGSVVVAGKRIVSVTDKPVEAPEAHRIDASGKTVLPGLIDTHVHLLLDNDDPPVADSDSVVEQFIEHMLPDRLDAYLQAGFTTLMSMGDFWPHVREVRQRLASGELRGPRLLIVGPLFTAPGTHPAYSVCEDEEHRNPWCLNHLVVEVDEAEAARAEVQRLAASGTDAIKVVYSGRSPLRPPVTRAITKEAHRHGLTVYMHPGEDEEANPALEDWGVDRFAHVPETSSAALAERVAEAMSRHGASAATTLSVFVAGAVQDAGFRAQCDPSLAKGERKLRALADVQRTLQSLAGRGLLAFGTDVPMLSPSDAVGCELRLLADSGLGTSEIVRSLTIQAAAHVGRAEELGSLEPGKLADLIVVDGNPLEDLSALRNVEVVVKGGEVVKDSRTPDRGTADTLPADGSEPAQVRSQEWSEKQREVWEREVEY